MAVSATEITKQLFSAINQAKQHPEMGEDWLEHNLPTFVKGYASSEYFYEPDSTLIKRIDDYKLWCQKRQETKKSKDSQEQERLEGGRLMEEIAFLAFRCLKGWTDIKSYQSYAAQHDLVVSGSDFDWVSFITYLRPAWQNNQRTIVVEAKNHHAKIDDQIFSRLCGVLQTVFEHTSSLGVFFTRFGASGFPEENRVSESSRLRAIKDAQATQIIYYAKTGKCVVVFSHNDILELVKPGSLPRLLEAKIKAIEEWTGLPIRFIKYDGKEWREIDLPPHLKKYIPIDNDGPTSACTLTGEDSAS